LRRRSRDSTLTVPWKRSLATLGFNVSLPEAICGCGWPAHLLLPKGTPKGQVFDLVVMLTDGTDDIVGDENVGTPQPNCISAPILAGVYHKFYPDRKPMGYPFDRAPFKQYNSLEEFVSFISNMATTQVEARTLKKTLPEKFNAGFMLEFIYLCVKFCGKFAFLLRKKQLLITN